MSVVCSICHRNFDLVPPAEERLKFAKRMIPNGVYVCEDCLGQTLNPKGGGAWREPT